MSIFISSLHNVEGFFNSPGGKHALLVLNTLTGLALPIVQQIAAATGNAGSAASVATIEAAFGKFGVPVVTALTSDATPAAKGAALEQLGVAMLQKNLPVGLAATATNLLTTAVNLAVSAHVAAQNPPTVA